LFHDREQFSAVLLRSIPVKSEIDPKRRTATSPLSFDATQSPLKRRGAAMQSRAEMRRERGAKR
jgi:hypothetical protein